MSRFSRQIKPEGRPLVDCMRDYYERYISLDDGRRRDHAYLEERDRRIDFLVNEFRQQTSLPEKYRMTRRRLISNLRHGKPGHRNQVFLYAIFLSIEDKYDILERECLSLDVFRMTLAISGRKTNIHDIAAELDLTIAEMVNILNGTINPICQSLSLDIRDLLVEVDRKFRQKLEDTSCDLD